MFGGYCKLCGCAGNGKQHSLTTLTEVFFRAFSSVLRQMPGFNSQSRGTVRTLKLVVIVLCYRLYSCAVVICVCSVIVCVVLRIEIVRTTTLPPGVNPIAVVKYIYIYKWKSRLFYIIKLCACSCFCITVEYYEKFKRISTKRMYKL